MPGLQQAIHHVARQLWERPAYTTGTVEMGLQEGGTLTETHAQGKTHLADGDQRAFSEQRYELLGAVVTQVFETNIHVSMHPSQAGTHSGGIRKIDVIEYEGFVAQRHHFPTQPLQGRRGKVSTESLGEKRVNRGQAPG